jgi:hypothetical protein
MESNQSILAPVDCAYDEDILVLGDGTALVRRVVHWLPPEQSDYRRVEIRPPEFFDACSASSDPKVLYDCLSDWFVPDSCVGEPCCPAGMPSAEGWPTCDG